MSEADIIDQINERLEAIRRARVLLGEPSQVEVPLIVSCWNPATLRKPRYRVKAQGRRV
jgi:hypothetical protein